MNADGARGRQHSKHTQHYRKHICFKYLISTIKKSLEIGHVNLGKWSQQREKKTCFPSKTSAWVTTGTQVPEMAQTSPCLLMGERHESVAHALLREGEGC